MNLYKSIDQSLKGFEKNKLIAQFMGGEYERRKDCFSDRYFEYYYFMGGQGNWRIEKATRCQYASEMLMYHTDWDWLMPVVEKIENTSSETVAKIFVSINGRECGYWNYFNAVDCLRTENSGKVQKKFTGKTKIEAVYNACVHFIEWYNKQLLP